MPIQHPIARIELWEFVGVWAFSDPRPRVAGWGAATGGGGDPASAEEGAFVYLAIAAGLPAREGADADDHASAWVECRGIVLRRFSLSHQVPEPAGPGVRHHGALLRRAAGVDDGAVSQ